MTSDPRYSLALLAVLAPIMATDSCNTEKMEPGTSGCQGTLTPNHFLHGQIGGSICANFSGFNAVQPSETMALDTRASRELLAALAPRMATDTFNTEKNGTRNVRMSR